METQLEVVEFRVEVSDEFHLNIESVNHTPKIILTKDNIELLAEYDLTCFPQKKCKKITNKIRRQYYLSLIEFLTDDFEIYSESDSDSMICDDDDTTIYYNGFYGIEFKQVNENTKSNRKVEWKFFAYMINNLIAASCLVEHNLIYNSYEIHSVCVGEIKKGHCGNFIPKVFEHLGKGIPFKEDYSEIKIYCENANEAACKCYDKIPNVCKISKKNTTAYVLYSGKINQKTTSKLLEILLQG